MIKNFIILSFSNLLNQKKIALINIIGLVIAFSTVLQIGKWCWFEWSFDKYQSKADRIYRFTVEENKPEENFYWHFARCWQTWRTKLPEFFPEIESLIEMRPLWNMTIKIENNLFFNNHVFEVDSSMFSIFDFNFIVGNPHAAINAGNTLVVSKSFAQKYFHSTNIVGKDLELYGLDTNGFNQYIILGVFDDMPQNSHFHADILVHHKQRVINGNDFAFTYILLKEGTSIKQIESRIQEFKYAHVPENQRKSSIIHFTPLKDIHLKSNIEREIEPNGDIKQVVLFIFIGLGILLISLVNYINILLVSLEKRSKFFGINLLNGAKKRHNFLILLCESTILSLIVLAITLALLNSVSQLMVKIGIASPIPFPLNGIFILTILGILTMIVVSGIVPYFIVRLNPVKSLINPFSSNRKQNVISLFNKPLLVLQIAISTVVIICSLVLNKQNNYLFSKNLGNHDSNIIMIHRNFWVEEPHVMRFKEELLKYPEIADVTMTMDRPGYLVKDGRSIEYADIPEENKNQVLTILPVDGNFFSFFNLEFATGGEKPYVTGQQFENYVLNESAIKKLGYKTNEDAVGSRFMIKNYDGQDIIKGGTIVGVIRDFNFSSLYNPIQPTIFFQKPVWQWLYMIKPSAGNVKSAIDYAQKTWQKNFPEYPFDYEFLSDYYSLQYHKDVITNKLVRWFSIISILLSVIGLSGISSINILHRTKEVGVRKVNGAKTLEILTLLNIEFIRIVAVAFIISCPVAWYLMHKWLENFAYKTNLSWWIFVLAGVIALSVALITVSWQTWRAARRNPVESLRYE
ncbi:MAG: ABC transporter permease [Bacteroidales bacterium]|nr:ABC transporter permease [Bacteroidales bacterium]